MEYFLFTFPNCVECGRLKGSLAREGIEAEEYDLTAKEGRLKVREFLDVVKRDDKGAIILPALVVRDSSRTEVFNKTEELLDWLKSRD